MLPNESGSSLSTRRPFEHTQESTNWPGLKRSNIWKSTLSKFSQPGKEHLGSGASSVEILRRTFGSGS